MNFAAVLFVVAGTLVSQLEALSPPLIECDFIQECGENEIFNRLTCSCTFCDFSIPCDRGYIRGLVPGSCDCFLACDYIMICEGNNFWDFIECECVPCNVSDEDYKKCVENPNKQWENCKCSCSYDLKPCETGLIRNLDTCECEPQIVCDPAEDSCNWDLQTWLGYPVCGCGCKKELEPCWNNKTRDPLTCECEPQIVCDPAPDACNWNYQIWLGYPDCKCGCPKDVVRDCKNTLQYFDEKFCRCQCKNGVTPETCPKPLTYNADTCTCKCIKQKCPSNKKWNSAKCRCECLSNYTCKPNKYWDDQTCSCKCKEPCQTCAKPQIWRDVTCDCGCTREAYALKKTCVAGVKFWDEPNCSCSCLKKKRECCENKQWDDSTCNCECSALCKCAPGFVWDPYTCDCVCEKKIECISDAFERYFDPSSCQCLCEIAKYSKCAYGFNHTECRCKTQDEYCLGKCPETAYWDGNFCTCVEGISCVSRYPPFIEDTD